MNAVTHVRHEHQQQSKNGPEQRKSTRGISRLGSAKHRHTVGDGLDTGQAGAAAGESAQDEQQGHRLRYRWGRNIGMNRNSGMQMQDRDKRHEEQRADKYISRQYEIRARLFDATKIDHDEPDHRNYRSEERRVGK